MFVGKDVSPQGVPTNFIVSNQSQFSGGLEGFVFVFYEKIDGALERHKAANDEGECRA